MFAAVSRAFFIFLAFANLNYGAADICSSRPPRVYPHECCDYPALFTESAVKSCGVQAPDEGSSKLPPCDVMACVFKQENMIKEDQKIDIEGGKAFILKWGADHPEWSSQSEEIANKCFTDAALQSGPPGMCEPMKVNFCVGRMFISTCPANHWTASEQCENVRTYQQQCHRH